MDSNNPNNSGNVIVKKMAICPEGQAPTEIDLSLSADDIKKTKVVLKEGCTYHLEVYFYVQREIVAGLRYFHAVERKGIKVDKSNNIMGSYGPKSELQMYRGPDNEAPSGMLRRGDYAVKSSVTDDDKNSLLQWEWSYSVKADFE